MRNKGLKISSIYLVGTLFNRGISFITVPIFTRLLSTNDYGIVTTYTAWVSIVGMVIGCALHMGIRSAYVDYLEKIDRSVSSAVTFTILLFGGVAAIVLCGIWLLHINVNLAIVAMCLFQGLFSAMITDYSTYLMMRYRYKMRMALMVGPNLLASVLAILAIVFVMKTDLYMGRIATYCLSYLVFGFLVLFLVFRANKPCLDKELLSYMLKISSPLIIHGIALTILSQSDRTMITALADTSQTGIYSLVYNIGMIGTVITTGLEGVWVPWFMRKMKQREYQEINRITKSYINLMAYLMILLVLIAPEILKLLAPPSYWEGIAIIPPIILANYIIFLYTMYVNVEHFFKRTVYISINTAIAATSNIVLNYLFIPLYGYTVAAYTTLFSYLLSLFLHSTYAKKIEGELFPIKLFVEPLAHIGVTILVFYCFMQNGYIRWGIAVIYAFAMLYRDRRKLGELFPRIQEKIGFPRQSK